MTTQTAAQNRKKPRGKPFPPGNNANPGGRPKLPADIKNIRELAREYTQDAMDALARVLKSSNSDSARVSAANALLDRGWGKAEQVVAGAGENGEHIHRVEHVIVDTAG